MDTLLIVGIDTTLGANLALSLSDQFQVCGVALGAAPAPRGFDVRKLGDPTPQRIRPLLAELTPSWLIHAGHLARSNWESPAVKINWQQETALAIGLGTLAHEAALPFCCLSTDAVFAGPRLFHEETARATGDSPLAAAAREAEAALASLGALVVRTHAYGWSVAGEGSPMDQLWRQLSDGQRLACEGRDYVTPILASDLAALLVRGFERKLRGLYHVTGAERTNRIRFARELASALGLGIDEHGAAPSAELAVGPAVETSLNTRRARRDFESPMPLLREGIDRLAAQRHNGYLDRLRSFASSKASHAA